MEKVIYECKKCGKICNGAGVSFFMVPAGDTVVFAFSAIMERFPEHACREEHVLQMVGDAIREIRDEGKVKAGQALEAPARETPAETGEGQAHSREEQA